MILSWAGEDDDIRKREEALRAADLRAQCSVPVGLRLRGLGMHGASSYVLCRVHALHPQWPQGGACGRVLRETAGEVRETGGGAPYPRAVDAGADELVAALADEDAEVGCEAVQEGGGRVLIGGGVYSGEDR
jgi:hypothetical protein